MRLSRATLWILLASISCTAASTEPEQSPSSPTSADAAAPAASFRSPEAPPAKNLAEACLGEATKRSCYTGPSATEGVGVCHGGIKTCKDGFWGPCEGEVLPSREVCDNKDNDCNGLFDEGCSCQAGELKACYTGPAATEGVGVCKAGSRTCIKGTWSKTCFAALTPSPEQCDGLDNDCNGVADDRNDCDCISGEKRDCYSAPAATVGKGACRKGSQTCVDGKWGACSGEVIPKVEVCDGIDNNCDGTVDNEAPCAAGLFCKDGSCQAPPPSSCPFVYAFDGKAFDYETTVGGASLIGSAADAALGRELRFSPMLARLSHAVVERRADKQAHSRVKAKLLIAEDEIAYVDQASLVVVDHPVGYEVLSSTSAQWTTRDDPQELIALRTAALRPPVHASWMGTTNVTREIASLDDHAIAHDTRADNFYELDFGAVRDPRRTRLVVDGWKFKEQRGVAPAMPRRAPHLEVLAADGKWKTALELAHPRGDRKAVVFDLATVDWPEGRYHMRLYTGTNEDALAMWYIDRVRLTEEGPARVGLVDLTPTVASLAWRGTPSFLVDERHSHPRLNRDDGKGELASVQPTGAFTRYGEVGELLAASDDMFVVMKQGDAITLEFDGVPLPRNGRAQTVFLHTDLVFKPRVCVGCSAPTKVSAGVLPLPFHGMTRYPYGVDERFPGDERHRAWAARFQTRSEGDAGP